MKVPHMKMLNDEKRKKTEKSTKQKIWKAYFSGGREVEDKEKRDVLGTKLWYMVT